MKRYIENEADFANLAKGDTVRIVVVHHLTDTERFSGATVERVTRRGFDREAGVERAQYFNYNRAASRFVVEATTYKPQEVAYRDNRGDWKRKTIKTRAAFDRFAAKMEDEAREWCARDAEGF